LIYPDLWIDRTYFWTVLVSRIYENFVRLIIIVEKRSTEVNGNGNGLLKLSNRPIVSAGNEKLTNAKNKLKEPTRVHKI